MKIAALGARLVTVRRLIPGLLVTSSVAMSAAFLGSQYKSSTLLSALLLGLALHFVSEDGHCAEGIHFASNTVLRLSVALLGLRLTIEHVLALGWQTVAVLLCAVALTIFLGLMLANILRVERSLGLLVVSG